jgi:hypothetical protein
LQIVDKKNIRNKPIMVNNQGDLERIGNIIPRVLEGFMQNSPQYQVLKYLSLPHRWLTVKRCSSMFKTTELRKIISRLRQQRYMIGSEWMKDRNTRYKRYYLRGDK